MGEVNGQSRSSATSISRHRAFGHGKAIALSGIQSKMRNNSQSGSALTGPGPWRGRSDCLCLHWASECQRADAKGKHYDE